MNHVDKQEGQTFADKVVRDVRQDETESYGVCLRTGQKIQAAIAASFGTKTEEEKRQIATYRARRQTRPLRWKREAKGDYVSKFQDIFRQTYRVDDRKLEVDKVLRKQYGLQGPLSWSEFTFYAWRQRVRNQRANNTANVPDTLQAVEAGSIANETTKAIMRYCYDHAAQPPRSKDQVEWTMETHGDLFVALLGTPNALGAGWLLADHNDELGGYIVDKIMTGGVDGGLKIVLEKL
ncbi:hypothetical protein CLCR_10729 [Cladophialophora carrionii]|uniref:Uncharacterized protein n=1 Tax=Cladophialophora carrionii TaxID=86049 RepID=A0A1C1CV57_9EURO|nr:hypothetical protein CLCR_10729 [Cladophialophora carrionii]